MRKKFNFLIVLSGIISISVISLMPLSASGTGAGMPFISIIFHVTAYFLLSLSITLYLYETQKGAVEALIIAAFFGVLMEMGQTRVPGRYFSFLDIAYNSLGASMVLLDYKRNAVNWMVRTEDKLIRALLDRFAF